MWSRAVNRRVQAAHDRAFVVAGALKADLLDDLQQSVTQAIEEGKSIQWFRQEFGAIVAQHGWTGWTGEDTPEGVAWRTRVIYQTNLTTSYAAGRYAQLTDPELLKLRPYWKYVHSDTVQTPRPLHVSWGNKPVVLPPDDPWWKTHFPPNGWGCFPGDTLVRATARLGQRFRYAGKLVKLETRGGQRLTVTPNHPVLTRHGWRPAGELKTGDQVLTAALDSDAVLPGIVDDPQPPTRADELFQALTAEGLRIVPMTPDDFHGDALGGKGEVHIAGADRVLMDIAQAEARESLGKGRFQRTLHGGIEATGIASRPPLGAQVVGNAAPAQDAAHGRLGQPQPFADPGLAGQPSPVEGHRPPLGGQVAIVGGLPGRLHEPLPPVRRSPLGLPALGHTGGPITALNALQPEDPGESAATDAQFYGQLLEANAGLIAADEICFIRQFDGFDHVYDFTTTTGLIMAGGIVVSNCRCRIVAVRAEEYRGQPAPDDGTWSKTDRYGVTHDIPKGIDYGWDYAPGRTWTPEVEKYPDPLAREVVKSWGEDGVFGRWEARLAAQLKGWRAEPRFAGLEGEALLQALRQAGVMPTEKLAMAIIDPAMQARLATERKAVYVSADTLIKQMIKREGQPIDVSHYATLQALLDRAEVITQQDHNRVLYWTVAGRVWKAVLKATSMRDEIYLLSLHPANPKDIRRQVPRGDWEKLGVA